MDLLKSLKAFQAVVDAGGFAAAAREMGVSRAVVNKQVQQLETHLGTQLLARSTRVVTPTESGLAFFERSRTVLDDLDSAICELTENEVGIRGNLRINVPMTFGTMYMAPVIAEFMAHYPDIHVEVTLSDRFVDLIEEGFDVTVRIAEAQWLTSVVTRVVSQTDRVLCASPAFLADSPVGQPDDLKTVRCLHYGLQQTGQRWHLAGPDGETSVRVNCVMWSNNGQVLREAAAAAQGIAMLPSFLVGGDLQTGRMQRVLPEYGMTPLDIALMYPRHRQLSGRLRTFIDFVAAHFEGRPSWSLVE